jgi:Type-IV b secretion system, inner-membrane complex component
MTLGHKPHTTQKPIILGLAALLTISIAPTAEATDKITQGISPVTDNAIQTPALAAGINNPEQEVTTPATSSNTPVSLDQPNLKSDAVLTWASEAAKSVYSYDFKNHKKQIQIDQQYFTPAGWRAFMEALNKSNNLKIVGEKKLVASATANGNPAILEEGAKNGRYVWKVVVPLLATYENESKSIKQNLQMTMLITRTNTPTGIGISHFVAEVVPSNQLSQLTAPQPTTNQPTVNQPTNPSTITPSPQTIVPPLPSQPQPGNVPAPMNNTMPPSNYPNAPQPGMPQTQMPPPTTTPPTPSSPVRSY